MGQGRQEGVLVGFRETAQVQVQCALADTAHDGAWQCAECRRQFFQRALAADRADRQRGAGKRIQRQRAGTYLAVAIADLDDEGIADPFRHRPSQAARLCLDVRMGA